MPIAGRKQFACRRAAVFSDIHSNYHAFRACFDDALKHGADCFIFLGDYISDLAAPVKTLDLVYEIRAQYPTICLRGNRERYMLECEAGTSLFSRGSKSGSLLYTFEQLRAQDLAFFKSLPIYDVIVLNGIPIEIAHAVRENDRYYFECADAYVLEQMECAYLLTGHSHRQYIDHCQGKTVINPGSIGVPMTQGNRAQYALLEVSAQKLSCELRQIPYDIKAAIHSQFESGLVDYAGYWAISILYDVVTGEEYTMNLLRRVYQRAEEAQSTVHDEAIWKDVSSGMGMRFTENEILDLLAE